MGFNSTIIIMNDCLHEIKDDKEFGQKLHDAIIRFSRLDKEYRDISSGCCCNAATVVDCHHADSTSLIAVGGNCATVLAPYVGGFEHHTEDAKLNILKKFADGLGYNISKKRNPGGPK